MRSNLISKVRSIAVHTGCCLVIFAGIIWVERTNPFLFAYLTTEDWWGEFATAIAYVLSAVLLLLAMKNDRTIRKPGYGLMALGLFFIGMEEVSWGQRLFRIETPDIITKFNYQSEINLHNTVFLPLMTMFCYGLIIWIFILPFLSARFAVIKHWKERLGIPQPAWSQVPYFVLAMSIFFFDLLVNHEPAELILGLAFLSFSSMVYFLTKTGKEDLRIQRLTHGLVILLLLVGMTGLLVSIGSRRSSYNWRLHNMASEEYPEHGLYRQAENIFEYMVDNPEFSAHEAVLLDYALFLDKIDSPKKAFIAQKALAQQYQYAQQKPESPNYFRNAGVILKLLGENEKAKKEFEKSVALDKMRVQKASADWERSFVLFSLGRTYVEMGSDPDLALQHLQEARTLAYSSRDKDNIKQWILRAERSMQSQGGGL